MTTLTHILPELAHRWDWKRTKSFLIHAVRSLTGGALVAVIISIALQLMYPRSIALPQTHVGGKSYGFRYKPQIASDIMRLNGQPLQIQIGEQVLSYRPSELGITLDGAKDAETATKYSWRERMTPFSLFLERRDVPRLSYDLDEEKARTFAESLKQYDKAPVNAVVKLEGTSVVVEKGQTGFAYETDEIVAALKNLSIDARMLVDLSPKVNEPDIPDGVASEAALSLQQRLQSPLKIEAKDKSISVDPATLATWMVLTPDATNKKLHITYDREKVKTALAALANQVYKPASPSGVTLLDGVETARSGGAAGEALHIDATADAVLAVATGNQVTVQGVMQPIAPVYRVDRHYTRSSKGMQALLNYWDESNAGTWGIAFKDLSGNISASLNPDRQFTSASVYKIYVAYVVYTKSDSGEISMNAPTSNGNNVSGCMELMVVRSDNACGAALGDMIGWGANNDMLHARGFASTSITYGDQLTTANDAANYLLALQKGTLLSSANRADMLSKMERGIYRYAIPAGSPGIPVANKLGALGLYSHDVAIVYHPKGAYVLAVFSYGSNHARIRELARQIAEIMSQ